MLYIASKYMRLIIELETMEIDLTDISGTNIIGFLNM